MHEEVSQNLHPQEQWEQYTNMPVGEILRRTRNYYNLSLTEVENSLRIRASQLAALEEERFEQLPGRVYAIGFVRAYAEFLGLDGGKMVHLFKAQSAGNGYRPELNFPATASESKLPSIKVLASAAAALVILVIAVTSFAITTSKNEVPEVPSEFVEAKAQVLDVYGPITREQHLAGIMPAAGTDGSILPDNRIEIGVSDNVWVEIRDAGGKAILSRILKPGDSYLVPDQEGLVLDTGNAGVLQIIVDGEEIQPIGEIGDVRRAVSLDPDSLKSVEKSAENVHVESEVDLLTGYETGSHNDQALAPH